MTEPDAATKAMQDLLDQGAMVTLAYSNAAPGTRLMALKDVLDGLQQRLSRLNALMTMYPDIRLSFQEGEPFTESEISQLKELEEAVQFSIPDRLDGRLVARLHDGRAVASDLMRALDGRPVTFVWDAAARVGDIDVTEAAEALVEALAPNADDMPGFWDSSDEDVDHGVFDDDTRHHGDD